VSSIQIAVRMKPRFADQRARSVSAIFDVRAP
jgi:hypothetical protein